MPFGSVLLVPGVNVERTPTLLQAGYSQTMLGRFKDGLFQKLGGWTKFYPFTVSGIPRALHAWQDLNQVNHLAVGTTTQLGVETAGVLNYITPQTLTSDNVPNFSTIINTPTVTIVDASISDVTTYDTIFLNTPITVGGLILSGAYQIASIVGTHSYTITAASNATATVNNGGTVPHFATLSGSPTVTITLTAHGLSPGDVVVFDIPTTLNGVTILGSYVVLDVPNLNDIHITAANTATGTGGADMNSGNAELVYYINLGPAAAGSGFGLGGFGLGGFGTGIVPIGQTGTAITATDYTLDNWGQIILACPHNGGIYFWDPTGGSLNAGLIATGPIFNGGIFVSMPAQILVAWGSTVTHDLGVQRDPLEIKWSDSEDYTIWNAASTNQAGSYRIPTGSRIVGGLQGPQKGLIWTDLDLWAMDYLGPPLVFGFNKIGGGAGAISAHGMCQLGGAVFWVGRSNFFRLAGQGVEVIPCSVWDVIFQDLDTDNLDKVRLGANTPFNEIICFYPSLSGGTGECDKYVKCNILENAWDYGALARSAWIDQSVLGMPIAASPSSYVYQHETTNDADGAAMAWSFLTGYFYLSEGEDFVIVDQVLPDFKWGTFAGAQTAQVQLTFYVVNFPGETPRTYGPYTATQATKYISTRFRGRQMAMLVSGNDLGSFVRLGKLKFRFASDGRR